MLFQKFPFADRPDAAAERMLAESKHFLIYSEYETVMLVLRETGEEIMIGDLYGDPEGAFISADERFAVLYGCGAIVYFLRPPFQEYAYDANTEQWTEWYRDGETWVTQAHQTGENEITLTLESGEKRMMTV